MRILFLSDLLAYGGASKLIYDLLPRMKAKGHECELMILTDDHSKYIDDLRQKDVPVFIVPKSIISPVAKIRYLKKWIEKGNYDVLHANLFPMIYYCSVVKKIIGKKCPPLVMTEHSTDNKRRHKTCLRPLEKMIYKSYDSVISISDKTQENLCRWLESEATKKFSVIENGIDIEMFKCANEIPRCELFPEYHEGDVLLLMVGSFTPQKNHNTILDALSKLPERYKLLLAGEGPLLDGIKEKVHNMSLDRRVEFLGFRRDVAQIMHSTDVLIIPSKWEGFGLIAVEGMACGLPIAASDVPGLAEVVGGAGILFDPVNPIEISNSIMTMESEAVKHQLLVEAGNRIHNYDIDRTVTEYLRVYSGLLTDQ